MATHTACHAIPFGLQATSQPPPTPTFEIFTHTQIRTNRKHPHKHTLSIFLSQQIVELRPEADRFLRLLELLGEWYEAGKVLVFVQSQDKCDNLFRDLLKVCVWGVRGVWGGVVGRGWHGCVQHKCDNLFRDLLKVGRVRGCCGEVLR